MYIYVCYVYITYMQYLSLYVYSHQYIRVYQSFKPQTESSRPRPPPRRAGPAACPWLHLGSPSPPRAASWRWRSRSGPPPGRRRSAPAGHGRDGGEVGEITAFHVIRYRCMYIYIYTWLSKLIRHVYIYIYKIDMTSLVSFEEFSNHLEDEPQLKKSQPSRKPNYETRDHSNTI